MRRSSNRPIIERLPYIRIGDIAKLIPRHNPDIQVNPDAYGWRYPGKVMLSRDSIRITDAAIVPQCFRLARINLGMGKQRLTIVCQCRRKAPDIVLLSGSIFLSQMLPSDLSLGKEKPLAGQALASR